MSIKRTAVIMNLRVLSLIVPLLFSTCSCMAVDNSGDAPPSRVFLLGLDGLDLDILKSQFDEGKLPNLKKLWDSSAHGPIRDDDLYYFSPVVWNTVSTGRDERDHGIRDFRMYHGSEQVMYADFDLRTPPVWEILGSRGLKSYVIGWLNSRYSAPPNAVVLSDQLVYSCEPNEADIFPVDFPLSAAYEICDKVYSVDNISDVVNIPIDFYSGLSFDNKKPIIGIKSVLFKDDFYSAASFEILDRKPLFNLFAAYLSSTDAAGHAVIEYEEADLPDKSREVIELAVDGFFNTYKYMDEKVGEFLKYVNENDYVIILSDHGFGMTGEGTATSDPLVDGPIKPGPFFDHELILDCLGFVDYADKCAWERPKKDTLLYRKGIQKGNKVLLSFDGYEEYTADPGKEAETMEAFLKTANEITCRNGTSLYSNVGEIIKNKPWENGESAVMEFNDQESCESLRINGNWIDGNQFLRYRSSVRHHRYPGAFIIKGPGVVQGELKQTASYYSVAPTVIYLLGQPVPENMDGGVMTWLFDDKFTAGHKVVQGPPAERTPRAPRKKTTEPTKEEDQEIKRLKQLGYIQ